MAVVFRPSNCVATKFSRIRDEVQTEVAGWRWAVRSSEIAVQKQQGEQGKGTEEGERDSLT